MCTRSLATLPTLCHCWIYLSTACMGTALTQMRHIFTMWSTLIAQHLLSPRRHSMGTEMALSTWLPFRRAPSKPHNACYSSKHSQLMDRLWHWLVMSMSRHSWGQNFACGCTWHLPSTVCAHVMHLLWATHPCKASSSRTPSLYVTTSKFVPELHCGFAIILCSQMKLCLS